MTTGSEQPSTGQPDQAMLVGLAAPTRPTSPSPGSRPAEASGPKNHRRADRPRLASRRPRFHALAEAAIRVLAFTSIAAIILIFVFIGKEAWPLFHSAAI